MLERTVPLEEFFHSIGLRNFYTGDFPGQLDWQIIPNGKLEESIRNYKPTELSTGGLPLRCWLNTEKSMNPAWTIASDGTLFIFREAKAYTIFHKIIVHATIVPKTTPEEFEEGWFMAWELREQWNKHHKA